MATESEARLENQLVSHLVNLGYEKVIIKDETELDANFRTQINKLNHAVLNGSVLSDSEFTRLMVAMKSKGVVRSSKMLRDKLEVQRDDNSNLFVQLFDSHDKRRNTYQVTQQVTVVARRENRYDVTILVNGLPLVQIELKRRGIELSQAFNQINRYRRETFVGLYEFLQLFVVSNGVNTKYFANSPSTTPIPFSHTFYWTDENNARINELDEFVEAFLPTHHLADMIVNYMIIKSGKEDSLVVMRPYQIFAVKRVLKHALETTGNGYVWHTTGSGKTLTSFKLAQMLTERSKFSKVIFLVDRRDLNSQTIEEFNKFEADIVSGVENTRALVKQIKSSQSKLIVTTVQKMSNLVKSQHPSLELLKDEPILFMIDECHRSQFGEMHKQISAYFSKAQYFGFTGTPRFVENRSEDKRTTADIFGKCLHTYLIREAINDKNVLPFSVEYLDTFHKNDLFKDYAVESVDMQELLLSDERITLVTQDIIEQLPRKTQKGAYNAMFAVSDTNMLGKYFDKFTLLAPDLKIATIFSYGANEDCEGRTESSRDTLERAMTQYNNTFKTNFDMSSYNEYFADLSKRMKRKEINLLIVVNMFLTGFDSPFTNTLFFDKSAKHHSLLQAFSRTNRVSGGSKLSGNIRCYQPLKEKTDEAIQLFSQSDNTDGILAKPYEEILAALKTVITELLDAHPTPKHVDTLQGESEKANFIRLYLNVVRILKEIEPRAEFNYATANLGIDEQTLTNFRTKFLDLRNSITRTEKVSILSEIDFQLELTAHDEINVDYIKRLIENIDMGDKNKQQQDVDFILKQIDSTASPELRMKSEYLKKFITEVLPHLTKNSDVKHEFDLFTRKEFIKEVQDFADQSDISYDLLKEWISNFEYSGIVDRKSISQEIKLQLKERKVLTDSIMGFITSVTSKY